MFCCYIRYFFTIFSVSVPEYFTHMMFGVFGESGFTRQPALNVPAERPSASVSSNRLWLLRPLSRRADKRPENRSHNMSMTGLYIFIILVDTMPGSAAFTVMPRFLTRSAASRVKRSQGKFSIAIYRNTPKLLCVLG